MKLNSRVVQLASVDIQPYELANIKAVLDSGWLTQGSVTKQFESLFAERHGAGYGIATTSCTSSLHLILDSLGIKPGDEVIVPSFSWVATANVVVQTGAVPVLVDVDLKSFALSTNAVEQALSAKTKAVIAVHPFGFCADVDRIQEVIGPNIPIIEDAACAAGSQYKGKSAGTLGVAAAFSFHPRKSITTGEGGIILTDNQAIAKMARMKRNHGAEISAEDRHGSAAPYLLPDFPVLGYNYRMTDIQAALGLSQLKRFDSLLSGRRQIAERYLNALNGHDQLSFQPVDGHSWQSFVTVLDSSSKLSRNRVMEYLYERGISTRPGYHAIHMLHYYRERFGYKPKDCPVAEQLCQQSIALPLHTLLSESDVDYVLENLVEALKQ